MSFPKERDKSLMSHLPYFWLGSLYPYILAREDGGRGGKIPYDLNLEICILFIDLLKLRVKAYTNSPKG